MPDDEPHRTTEDGPDGRSPIAVVVKRNDQAVRHPDDTLEIAVAEGEEQFVRASSSLFLSAIAAGAILSFSALGVGVAATLTADAEGMAARLAIAALYPIGFVLCILSGTQLFTEHTALAVYPVLDRRARFVSLLRVWGTVFLGNAAGCAIGAGLLFGADDVVHASEGYAQTAMHFLGYGVGATFVSAVLAGWLMALGGWLVLSSPPAVTQVVAIYLVTFTIGFAGLHHAIAGMVEVFVAAMVGAEIGLFGAVTTICAVAAGNLVGGAVFVALVNYGHIRQIDRDSNDGEGS